MKRKIIQIAATTLPESTDNFWSINLYALADDGTLWIKADHANAKTTGDDWIRIENLPDDEERMP